MKYIVCKVDDTGFSRSPYGERGLKSQVQNVLQGGRAGRSPYGERGLKLRSGCNVLRLSGRSPYGERGLKYIGKDARWIFHMSLSLRRAWIEILRIVGRRISSEVALLTESVD